MRPLRRNDLTARVELLPLIDVVFLLLTFFIYSLIVVQRFELLPVKLLPLGRGEAVAPQQVTAAVVIDGQGNLRFNAETVTIEELKGRLATFAAEEGRGRLGLAYEAVGDSDRLPRFFEVWQIIRDAGISDVGVVVKPGTEPAGD